MLGKKSGFQARVKAVSPSVASVHCFLHQFALAAKLLPPDIKTSLNLVVKIVNYIKTSTLNSSLFKVICEDVESECTSLLFHTEVGWLCRKNTTMRLFVLRKELLQFLQTKNHKFQKILEDENFIIHLAYMSDILESSITSIVLFRRAESNIIDFSIKLTPFTRKLDLWIKNIENRQFRMFENVASLAGEPSIVFSQEIINHLLLKDEIKQYLFNDGDAHACTYIRNPFTVKPGDLPVGTDKQEELIDLQCDESAQEKFKNHKLAEFWLNVSSSYPALAKNALPQLFTFPTTWECEQGFSTFLTIKTKTRNRIVNPSTISDVL